jgi:centrosomal protein CEP120
MTLKQREMEFMNKLNEDWKRKESEREKQWKRTEVSINQIEAKLKGKASDLQKREQKLVLLEEELKHKMNETIKIITNKDDEILELKRKSKEERSLFEKEKQILK